MKQKLSLSLLFSVMLSLSAGIVKDGGWELVFRDQDGYWIELKWNGTILLKNPYGVPPFRFGTVKDFATEKKALALKRYYFDKEQHKAYLQYRCADYDITDIICFNPGGNTGLLARDLEVTYTPERGGNDPVIIKNFHFQYPLPETGSGNAVYFPTLGKKPESNRIPLARAAGSAGENTSPALVEIGKNRTLLFFPDTRNEWHYCAVQRHGKGLFLESVSQAGGWFYPGERQLIGRSYVRYFHSSAEEAFCGGMWTLFQEIGYTIPKDRPVWMKDLTAIAAFTWSSAVNASYTAGGNIPAVKKELIPRIKQLGFDALWIHPAHPDGPYSPRDYYAVDSKNGTVDDLKSFFVQTRQEGLRTFLDIVPHGGIPQFGKERGDKPWELIFDLNGNAYNYWCFDFGNPDWQKKVARNAAFLMKTYTPDALRIDAPTGSYRENWRKKDWPGINDLPKNVPPDWWKNELAKIGGTMPPMPYARASLSRQNYAGNQMVAAIRREVKKANPESGVLGEVQRNVNAIVSDMIYCSQWFTYFIPELLPFAEPDFFAGTISRYLEEQKFNDLKGQIRMHCMNYGSILPVNGDPVGIDLVNAVRAVTFFAKGVPNVYMNADIGRGMFIRKLTDIRRELPEFRRGDAHYLVLNTASTGVFSVVRNLKDLVSIGLVNFNPVSTNVEFELPQRFLSSQGQGLYDVWNHTSVDFKKGKAGSKVSLWLPPFGVSVLALRNVAPVFAEQERPAAFQEKENRKLTVSFSRWNVPTVKAPAYTAEFRMSGMLTELRGADGRRLLDSSQFHSETFLGITPDPGGKIVLTKQDAESLVLTSTASYRGAKVKLVWNCFKDRIVLRTELLEEPRASKNFGLLFSVSETERWQVITAEGLLDDFYYPRYRYGKAMCDFSIFENYSGTPVIWQNRTRPLSPVRPVVAAFRKDGSGVAFELNNPLKGGLDNILLMDKYNHLNNLHLSFLWSEDNAPFRTEKKHKGFSITIRPVGKTFEMPESRDFSHGNLTFRNISKGWHIENQHYKLEILRTGGSLVKLMDKTGNTRLKNMEFWAGQGFGVNEMWDAYGQRKTSGGTAYSSSNDVETALNIQTEGKKVILRFSGVIKTFAVSSRRIKKPKTFFLLEYTLDDSPEIGISARVYYVGKPGNAPRLGLTMQPVSASAEKMDGDIVLNGISSMRIAGLKGACDSEILRDRLNFMFLNKNKGSVQSHRWQTISFTIRTNEGKQR